MAEQYAIQNPTVGTRSAPDGMEGSRLRSERTGALVIQQLHAPYAEECVRGNIWTASTAVAGVTVTASCVISALAMPIIGVFNPTGSGRNLVIIKTIVQQMTLTAVTFVWAGGAAMGLTNANGVATHINNFTFATAASGGSVARSFLGASIIGATAPTAFRYVGGAIAGATAVGEVYSFTEYNDGDIVLSPNTFAGLFADTATSAAVVRAAITWAEVPS